MQNVGREIAKRPFNCVDYYYTPIYISNRFDKTKESLVIVYRVYRHSTIPSENKTGITAVPRSLAKVYSCIEFYGFVKVYGAEFNCGVPKKFIDLCAGRCSASAILRSRQEELSTSNLIGLKHLYLMHFIN